MVASGNVFMNENYPAEHNCSGKILFLQVRYDQSCPTVPFNRDINVALSGSPSFRRDQHHFVPAVLPVQLDTKWVNPYDD